jgi:acetyl esterase/lipase
MTARSGGIAAALWSLRGRPPGPEVRPTEAAVRYRTHARPGVAPLADVYLPADPTGASVLLVHGGAFVIGSRRMKPMRYLAARLCAAGIAVCAIDYRLIFRGGRLGEAIDDVGDALSFWSARAAQRGLDDRAVSLVGLSAGASLAMLVAARASVPVHGLACCFGLYDLDDLRGARRVLPRLLLGTGDRTAWRDRSPSGAPQPAVPTLLLHGSDDRLVPVEQAQRLAAHREAIGLPTRLVIYPGAPHGFFNLSCAANDDGVRELVAHVTRDRPPA